MPIYSSGYGRIPVAKNRSHSLYLYSNFTVLVLDTRRYEVWRGHDETESDAVSWLGKTSASFESMSATLSNVSDSSSPLQITHLQVWLRQFHEPRNCPTTSYRQDIVFIVGCQEYGHTQETFQCFSSSIRLCSVSDSDQNTCLG